MSDSLATASRRLSFAAQRFAGAFAMSIVPREALAFAAGIEAYQMRAKAIGVPPAEAERILQAAIDRASASPSMTSRDALDVASRELIEAAYRQAK